MKIDFDSLLPPLDGGDGCGPDLEADWQVGQLLAELDGLLPTKAEEYFAFRARPPDLDRKAEECIAALGRSRDLRLMVPLARMTALGGDLAAFERALGVVRHYLQSAFEAVHPRPTDGDQTLRVVELERLDEFASVVLPLQYANLVSDKAGQLAYRDLAVAAGEATARPGETFATRAEIDRLFRFAKVESIAEARDGLTRASGHLSAIALCFMAAETSVAFPRLSALLGKAAERLGEVLAERAPELAAPPTEPDADEPAPVVTEAAAVAMGRVRTLADAEAALSAVSAYFAERERSSPAALLVGQARALIGLSFPEILARIAPALLPETRFALGGSSGFVLSLQTLGDEFAPARQPAREDARSPYIADRADAAVYLAEVAAWYRTSEPSNPIPLILDKARDLMAKDFAALLTELTKSS